MSYENADGYSNIIAKMEDWALKNHVHDHEDDCDCIACKELIARDLTKWPKKNND